MGYAPAVAHTATDPQRETLAQRVAAELNIPGPELQAPMADDIDLGSATFTKMLGRRY
jgi:hypothetical protein